MKTDGSIIIDTKIIDGGMEKGFELIKDEMASVGMSAKKVGEQIQLSFSKMDISKPIAAAVTEVNNLRKEFSSIDLKYQSELKIAESLETEFEKVKAILNNKDEFVDPLKFIDAKEKSETLSADIEKQKKIVDSLEEKWKSVNAALESSEKKLTTAITKEINKQAAEEEKAAKQKAKAAEKQYKELTKPAKRFQSRLRELISGALVFNIISSGLRRMTAYFGNALKANNEYSKSLSALRGSLMTAFQPVYEAVLPAIITLIQWINVAVQAIGRFFAAISGKGYSQMQKNAEALNNQADALGSVGGAAKEAKKQVAAFDEINRLESTDQSGGGGGGSGSPLFESLNIPSEWESKIDSLALRVKDIFFKWDNLTPEIIAEKIVTALGAVAGGLIGFALGGAHGALIGMTIGAGMGVVLSSIVFDGDGELSTSELVTALVSGLAVIGGAAIGFAVGGPAGAAIGATVGTVLSFKIADAIFDGDGITAGELVAGCVAALMAVGGAIVGFAVGGPAGAAIGAVIGLGLTMTIEETEFDAVAENIKKMFESVRGYFSDAFSEGFISGVWKMVSDALNILWDVFMNFLNLLLDSWYGLWRMIGGIGTGGAGMRTPDYAANYRTASYAATPEIPHLAKGAVIPANNKFLAVLGDQTSGRNLEAPEDLIRQIVREESGGGTSDRIAQLLEILIATVEGIEVGDEVIGKAAARYNRSTARARGY